MSVIAEMAVNVVAKTNELAGGLNKAAGAFGGIGSKLSGMLPDLTSVNALMGGIAFGGMAAGFVAIADGLEEVLQTSQRLGVASEQYYALQIGAKNANIETETFDKAMTKLYKTLGDAATGSKGAAKAFSDLGIDVATFTKLRMDQQLAIIAQKLADMPDATQKTAAAMKLFGKAGSDLQNMLGEGAQGIRNIMTAAEELGVNGFTEDRLARVVQFNDAMDRLRGLISVQAQAIVIDISPAAEELVTALAEVMPYVAAVTKWTAMGVAHAMGNPDLANKDPRFAAMADAMGKKASEGRTWTQWAAQTAWSEGPAAAKAMVFGLGSGIGGMPSREKREAGVDTMTTVLKEILIESRKANDDNFLIGN